jgi:hypothetical protein
MYFFSMYPFDVVTNDNIYRIYNGKGMNSSSYQNNNFKRLSTFEAFSGRKVNAIKSMRFYLCSYIIDGNMISSIFECDI